MARNYSNTAFDTTLTAGIGAGDASLVVASASGWPAVPFAAVLDPGSLTVEEVVQVTNVAGTTFTITRGFDGTTAAAHANGATVRHAAIAGDFTDLQAADATNAGAIVTEANARAAADVLRLLISNYDWSTLPNKPAFGALALLNSITASLISDASANGQSLITAANYAAMLGLLGAQPLDADLTAIASLVSSANKLPYATGAQTWALTDLSVYIRTLLDDADAATARGTLGAAPASSIAIHTVTASGWAFPTTATYIYLDCIGGGAGGASGRRGAAGGIRGGGGGGGGAGRSWKIVRVSDLGGATTLDITIGAGTAGGVARTSDNQDGQNTSGGGTSTIAIGGGALLVSAPGGGGAVGGVSGSGGTAGPAGLGGDSGGIGGTGSSGAAAGTTPVAAAIGPSGGGGGGGISAADAVQNGGAGGTVRNSGLTGGAAGTAGGNGTAGGAGLFAGLGGGGGAASITGVAGSGANGGNYGGGGGGGGASLNGNNSGAGGAGANGVAIVIAW